MEDVAQGPWWLGQGVGEEEEQGMRLLGGRQEENREVQRG